MTLQPGAPRRLAAVGGALLAMELEHGERHTSASVSHLVQRRVHEHAGELGAAAQLRADPSRLLERARARAARPEDHPERPGAQVGRQLGVLERVTPQIFTLVTPAYRRQAGLRYG